MTNLTTDMAAPPDGSNRANLERVLNTREVIALAFGAMIGFGWIILTDNWIQSAGVGGAVAAFAIGGIAILFVGLTYAELSSAMPFVGGEHVYTYRALGDTASFWCTWMIVLGYVAISAFEAVAFPTVLTNIVGDYNAIKLWTINGYEVYLTWAMVGVLGSAFITYINIRGVETAAFIQTIVTLMIAIAGIALMIGAPVNGSVANTQPLFEGRTAGFFAVLVMVPALFVGFDVIPQAAEEINLPPKKIGSVLLLSVIIAVVFYILLIISVGMALNTEALASADMGTVDAGEAVLGGFGRFLLLLAGLAGILTSWNAFMVGGSRAIYALAHSNMLPKVFAKMHPTYNTPVNAILLIGALSALAPFFGRPMLVWLVDGGSFAIVFAYLGVAVSWIVLRRREPEMERPYKAGNSELVGWIAVGMSLFLMSLYLPGMPAALIWPAEWIIVGGWALIGAALYAWCRKAHGLADPKTIYMKS